MNAHIKFLLFTRSCITATFFLGLLMTFGGFHSRVIVTFGVPMLMASTLTMAVEVLVDWVLEKKDHERND